MPLACARVCSQVQLEAVSPAACAWCGARFDAASERLPGRRRCRACGVATTSPWPSEEELETAYAHYRPAGGRFAGPGDRVLAALRTRLARRIDQAAPPGPVLDVGAGDGTLMRALGARGRHCVGVEREQGPGVEAADVRELDGPWASVVFWHSLEHLPEPGAAFDHAARRLLPSGLIFVAAPNAASLQARAFGERWLALDLPRHLVHLPLAAVVERALARGLTPERVSHLRGGQAVFGWLHGLVGLLPGNPDLYDAIRRPEARARVMSRGARALTLAAGAGLLAPATVLALVEAALGRGGSFYVELRRA